MQQHIWLVMSMRRSPDPSASGGIYVFSKAAGYRVVKLACYSERKAHLFLLALKKVPSEIFVLNMSINTRLEQS